MATTSVWMYGTTVIEGIDAAEIIGFGVEAIDGSIGKADEATANAGTGYIIVDTGPWIFGKKVMLPGGVVSEIDIENEKVYVFRTKDEIKNAPEFDDSPMHDDTYISRVATHYGAGGAGYRDDPHTRTSERVVMIPVSIAAGWLPSVAYVSALSLWALVSGH